MGVDTKVFVIADESKLLAAVGSVNKYLDVFIRGRLDSFVKDKGYINRFNAVRNAKADHNGVFSNGIRQTFVNFTGDYQTFQICFGCGDDNDRMIHCSQNNCDYKDIAEGNKIIFSCGCWGSNKEIAKVLCEALASFGDVYYDLNDCDLVDFQLYNGEI